MVTSSAGTWDNSHENILPSQWHDQTVNSSGVAQRRHRLHHIGSYTQHVRLVITDNNKWVPLSINKKRKWESFTKPHHLTAFQWKWVVTRHTCYTIWMSRGCCMQHEVAILLTPKASPSIAFVQTTKMKLDRHSKHLLTTVWFIGKKHKRKANSSQLHSCHNIAILPTCTNKQKTVD